MTTSPIERLYENRSPSSTMSVPGPASGMPPVLPTSLAVIVTPVPTFTTVIVSDTLPPGVSAEAVHSPTKDWANAGAANVETSTNANAAVIRILISPGNGGVGTSGRHEPQDPRARVMLEQQIDRAVGPNGDV